MNLVELKRVLAENGGVLKLPVICNSKTVDPRDSSTTPVFQLEQAMGAAVECFSGAAAVNVPRSRFAPVKGTVDLFALRSDAYEVGADGSVSLAASRNGKPPIVKFSDHYKLVDSLESLGQPSLIEAEELTVNGLVRFAEGVRIFGKVSFTNTSSEMREIHAGDYRDQSIEL